MLRRQERLRQVGMLAHEAADSEASHVGTEIASVERDGGSEFDATGEKEDEEPWSRGAVKPWSCGAVGQARP